jgi:hypothetical protein
VLGFRYQGASGTDSSAGTAVLAGEIGRISTAEESDHCVKAPVGKSQKVGSISASANLNALAAKHAAEWIVGKESKVDLFVEIPFE